MAQCSICKEFFPPGLTSEIQGTSSFKCKFCTQGKDKIYEVNPTTLELIWINKAEVINEYKQFINQIARNQKEKEKFVKGLI
jgi:hypothetical protein